MRNIVIEVWDITISLQVYAGIYMSKDYVKYPNGWYQIPTRLYLYIPSPIVFYCPPEKKDITVKNAWIEPIAEKYGGKSGSDSEGLLYLETTSHGQIATPVTFVE